MNLVKMLQTSSEISSTMYHTTCMNNYIEDCADYDAAIETLTQLYIKTPNEIFARHLLATRRQKTSETLTEFFKELRKLSKDGNIEMLLLNNTERNWSVIPSSMEQHSH